MMFMVIFLMIEQVRIQPPDMFAPLEPSAVEIGEDGSLFVLNRREKVLYRFDAQGQKQILAEKGQGPDEINEPNGLTFWNGKLYLTDYFKGALVFSKDGVFEQLIKPPGMFLNTKKVANGWVYTKPDAKTKTTTMYWIDENMENPRVLLTYPMPSQELLMMLQPGGKVKIRFNPAQDLASWVISKDKNHVYAYVPGTRKIQTIDVHEGTVKSSFNVPGEQVDFVRGWGEMKREEIYNNTMLNDQKVTPEIETTYPTYFPLVADLTLGPQGNLYVSLGHSFMDENAAPMVFDPSGKKLETVYNVPQINRILKIQDDVAWVLAFDRNNETPEVIRCGSAQIGSLLNTTYNSLAVKPPQTYAIRTR